MHFERETTQGLCVLLIIGFTWKVFRCNSNMQSCFGRWENIIYSFFLSENEWKFNEMEGISTLQFVLPYTGGWVDSIDYNKLELK